jgi:acylphosphatase
MSGWISRRCLVAGRVQGVFYRASARDRARELGVTGYARNLADGRVEVLACGEASAVHALCEWLWQGSPSSHVTSVQVEELQAGAPAVRPEGFQTS